MPGWSVPCLPQLQISLDRPMATGTYPLVFLRRLTDNTSETARRIRFLVILFFLSYSFLIHALVGRRFHIPFWVICVRCLNHIGACTFFDCSDRLRLLNFVASADFCFAFLAAKFLGLYSWLMGADWHVRKSTHRSGPLLEVARKDYAVAILVRVFLPRWSPSWTLLYAVEIGWCL